MATVHVTRSFVRARADTGASLPVVESIPLGAETLTSTGSSAQGDSVAADDREIWTVTVLGGDVFVAFGADPTAGADAGWLLPAGDTRDFACVAVGEKIAVKDV